MGRPIASTQVRPRPEFPFRGSLGWPSNSSVFWSSPFFPVRKSQNGEELKLMLPLLVTHLPPTWSCAWRHTPSIVFFLSGEVEGAALFVQVPARMCKPDSLPPSLSAAIIRQPFFPNLLLSGSLLGVFVPSWRPGSRRPLVQPFLCYFFFCFPPLRAFLAGHFVLRLCCSTASKKWRRRQCRHIPPVLLL